jgi:hypothetical protein
VVIVKKKTEETTSKSAKTKASLQGHHCVPPSQLYGTATTSDMAEHHTELAHSS